MHSTLRTILPALVLTAAVAFVTKPALADAHVQVPFSFTVGGKTLPAGQYIVKTDAMTNTVSLANRRHHQTMTWVTVPTKNDAPASRVVLRFDADGGSHKLQSIQYGASITSRLDRTPQRDADDDGGADFGGR